MIDVNYIKCPNCHTNTVAVTDFASRRILALCERCGTAYDIDSFLARLRGDEYEVIACTITPTMPS